MATKEKSSKSAAFAKGGSGKMFGQQGAKPAKPGHVQTSQAGKGDKFAKGGKGKMFGFSPSVPKKSGTTSPR